METFQDGPVAMLWVKPCSNNFAGPKAFQKSST